MNEESKILSITQLTLALKNLLETRFVNIAIEGEVSLCKQAPSGHVYFSVKDENAQLPAVMYLQQAKTLSRIPKPGDRVVLKGAISVYPPRGNYQFIVKELLYTGRGALLLKLQELKESLQKRGYLDSKRKKPLPRFPVRIGIVTSPIGAVIQDVINVLSRRFRGFSLLLNPVRVQGEGAAMEIAKAISQFNQYRLCDVMIVGRGGGSLEDLWAFNEEIVAEAIFQSKIPIISAVGHETDFSIADFVADVRAPTPSAAAELAVREKSQLLTGLKQTGAALAKNILTQIKSLKQELSYFQKQPLFVRSEALLGPKMQQLDDFKENIQGSILQILSNKKQMLFSCQKLTRAGSPIAALQRQKKALQNYQQNCDRFQMGFLKERKEALLLCRQNLRRQINSTLLIKKERFNPDKYRGLLINVILNILSQRKERLIALVEHIKGINPSNLLQRGYSILFSEKDNSIILSTKDVQKENVIIARLSDGKIKLKVCQDGKSII